MKIYLIIFAIGLLVGGAATLGITKAVKPEIKLECEQFDYSKIPSCPQCPLTLGTEFEKVKGKNITLNLSQTLNVEMNGDSLIIKKIMDEMEVKLNQLRLARCK